MRATRALCIVPLLLLAHGLSIPMSTDTRAQAGEAAPREQVLVTVSGRIMSGRMIRNAGGWLVEQASGRVQVPEEQVKLVADNLIDAYRKQRDSVVEPTPATHVSLAQWCISYRLHDEARDELKKCLRLDPDHDEARRLLRRIDDTLTPRPAQLPSATILKTSDGFVVPEVESLGGLSKETATSFTARVQPLLMNKCGNASCHGSGSSSGFRLSAVSLGANRHRVYSERNLAEVLRFIDIRDPALSPLITVPQGSHGGTTSIFSGPAGHEQLKTLRAFVKTASQEKLKDEQELAARPSVVNRKKVSTSRTDVPADPSIVKQPEKASTFSESNAIEPPNSGADRTVDAEPESNDAFDPELFNRRFHGANKGQ